MTEDLLHLAAAAIEGSTAMADPDYPVFHVAPPVGRLNDPNGLIRDGGTYHAFYQFTPEYPRKLVYWGHATSQDLMSWTHHQPAILPDSPYDRNGAYSGTAVALRTGGYRLFYTGNRKEESGERRASQCAVFSRDLVTFSKDPDNPLIPQPAPGYTAHYRDPQVWKDSDGAYRMLVGAQRDNLTGAAVLYRSDDAHQWEFEGELTFPDAHGAFDSFGFMWECPNIVTLTDGETGEERQVFFFCPQGISPEREGFENIFPCVYIVGTLVGTEFRGATGEFTEVDRGFEFYAPQAFAQGDGLSGAVVYMGWAGNAGEDDQPSLASGGWVHTLTLPRQMSLHAGVVKQFPAISPEVLGDYDVVVNSGDAASPASRSTFDAALAAVGKTRTFRLTLEGADGSDHVGVRMGSTSSYCSIVIEGGVLTVDRSHSRYAHGGSRSVTLPVGCAPVLDVWHDKSVTEIYVGDGDVVFTMRTFVGVEDCEITLVGQPTVARVQNLAREGWGAR